MKPKRIRVHESKRKYLEEGFDEESEEEERKVKSKPDERSRTRSGKIREEKKEKEEDSDDDSEEGDLSLDLSRLRNDKAGTKAIFNLFQKDKKLAKELLSVLQYLKEHDITSTKILQEPLLIEDKARLLQMTTVLRILEEEPCQEYIDYHTRITQELEVARNNFKHYTEKTQLEKKIVSEYEEKHKFYYSIVLNTPLLIEDKVKLAQRVEALTNTRVVDEFTIENHTKFERDFMMAKMNYIDFNNLPQEQKDTFYLEKEKLLESSSILPLESRIVLLNADSAIKAVLYREYLRYQTFSSSDEERVKLESWFEICLSLPFNTFKPISNNRETFLRFMKDSLDREMFGLDKVKEQLLVFTNARLSNPNLKECILGLVGPPGIGKTMIARLISTCLDIPFSQISCGGLIDAEYVNGHSYTYIGSRPGVIVNSLIEMKVCNGVLFFDEFEKASKIPAVSALLLHILDPIQNGNYHDNYVGLKIPLDISKCWKILAMNEEPNNSALRDRIFVINLDGYSIQEKIQIVRRHIVPKILMNLNMEPNLVKISDNTILYLNERVSRDNKGMRPLKHALSDIIQKVHFLKESNILTSFNLGKISFPFEITNDVIDRIIPQKENESFMSLYT